MACLSKRPLCEINGVVFTFFCYGTFMRLFLGRGAQMGTAEAKGTWWNRTKILLFGFGILFLNIRYTLLHKLNVKNCTTNTQNIVYVEAVFKEVFLNVIRSTPIMCLYDLFWYTHSRQLMQSKSVNYLCQQTKNVFLSYICRSTKLLYNFTLLVTYLTCISL